MAVTIAIAGVPVALESWALEKGPGRRAAGGCERPAAFANLSACRALKYVLTLKPLRALAHLDFTVLRVPLFSPR